jgi:hypothetical protein
MEKRYLFETFQKIKKKAWKILKENYIQDMAKDPNKLFIYIKNTGYLPPDEIEITFKKSHINKTK